MCKGIPLKSPYHQRWFIYNYGIRSYMWYVCVCLSQEYDSIAKNHGIWSSSSSSPPSSSSPSFFMGFWFHKLPKSTSFFTRCVGYQVREDKGVPLRFESYLSALMGFGHIFLATWIGCKSLAGKSTAGWNVPKLPIYIYIYISYMSHMIYLCLFSIRASILQLLLHRNAQASFAICFCKLTQVLGYCGFKYIYFSFSPLIGEDSPCWRIFFKRVETSH